ncbi:subclass B3 metallo-beta-lactamase [Altererythrobacter luteolus]|uniref:Subclass B3 metallo-beta-lactamase n=1 Tax=Pontixanthobacter luteolus TaxID=295089 RepID=A0A6I4UX17_9SPHN|nr:subclass B3 metallo-beta-lactamase [Pontixanthobacter luteolus]MXP46439.1 subclass B3 metallo-beta-lactamase [Pontixanthobacter luteolus]
MYAKLASLALLAGTSLLASCANASAINSPALTEIPADQAAWAAECERWDNWDKPAPPFQIHGGTYYVGTCGISAILITGDEGHILIDSGTEAGADVIAANIRSLGIDPAAIDILLHSHEHFDHVGGHATIQALTNARVVTSLEAAEVLGSGIISEDDPQYGTHEPMTPVAANTLVLDGEVITLGSLELTAIETPGHSPGALSWAWRSCEGSDCRSIVYADSLSPVSREGYKFSDHAAYLGNYRQALGRVAALDCEILLTPHPSASDMVRRIESGNGLVDPSACQRYADSINTRLDERLDSEMGAPNGG